MTEKIISSGDYPLGKKRRDIIFSPGGKNIDDITFENIEKGSVDAIDCRTSRQSLLYQAQIARQEGNHSLAENFCRAAELIDIDDKRLIEIYNAIRPYRSTMEELQAIVSELRTEHRAEKTAEFIEEAADVLKKRRKLRGDR